MTLEEILEVLDTRLPHPSEATSHPDDVWGRARQNLIESLKEDFRREFE